MTLELKHHQTHHQNSDRLQKALYQILQYELLLCRYERQHDDDGGAGAVEGGLQPLVQIE